MVLHDFDVASYQLISDLSHARRAPPHRTFRPDDTTAGMGMRTAAVVPVPLLSWNLPSSTAAWSRASISLRTAARPFWPVLCQT